MMLDKYLSVKYAHNGNGEDGVHNCWSLVRLARSELFGLPMLPDFSSISATDKKALTESMIAVRDENGFKEVSAKAGAIATAFRGSLCVHLGLVVEADGRLWILEIDEPTGACLTPTGKFESRYAKVIYYAN